MVRTLPVKRSLISLLSILGTLFCLVSASAQASMSAPIGQVIEVEPILAIDIQSDTASRLSSGSQDIPLPEDGIHTESLDNSMVMINQEKQITADEALLVNAQLYARHLRQHHQETSEVQKRLIQYFTQAGIDQDSAQLLLKEINDKKVNASPIILQVLNQLASSNSNE